MHVVRSFFRALDLIVPGISARLVLRFMSRPRVRRLRPFEEEILGTAHVEQVEFNGIEIFRYSWGPEDAPIAFMIHGWEGQAGNFGGIVQEVLDKGYRIVAYDGPSHGKSSGVSTSMFEYAEFITEMFFRYRPSVIISHSFGTVAGLYALYNHREIDLKQWVAITTPFDFKQRIGDVRDLLGVTERTVKPLIALIEKRTGHLVDELNMKSMGGDLQNLGELLIIHSKTDKVIPIEDARLTAAAIPNASLIEIDNVGHYAILWAPQTRTFLRARLKPAN